MRRPASPGSALAAVLSAATALFALAVLAVALSGAYWTPHDPSRVVGVPWGAAEPSHPLGFDDLGRDMLSRLLAGGSRLVAIAVPSGLAASVLGAAAGLLAAWTPRGERVAGQVSAALLAVPGMLVVLVCAVTLPAWAAVLTGMLLLGVPLSARVVHAAALPLRRSGFVDAAVVRGESTPAILLRELLPAIAGTVLADAGTRMVAALQLTVAVHVLGFGPAPPAADWALMIRENLPGAELNPASVLAPAVMITLLAAVLATGLDALAGRLVPGTRGAAAPPRGRPARRTPAQEPGPAGPGTGVTPAVELSGVLLTDGEFTFGCDRFEVRPGEVVGLAGPSGAGKSTLLRLLMGEPRPGLRLERGSLRAAGQDLAPGSAACRRWRRRSVGLLAQDPASTLDPLRRCATLVADGLPPGLPRGERTARVAAVLARLGLPADVARRRPHALSGGQAGRVALARAVVGEPALLLADEPTSGLDAATAGLVLAEIERRRAAGLATVLVSHDLGWLEKAADRVLEVADGTLRAPRRRAVPPAGPAASTAAPTDPGQPGEGARAPVLRIRSLTPAPYPLSTLTLPYGVDIELRRGELVVLLGPSGTGKSTLLRAVCGLHPAAAGTVELAVGGQWETLATTGARAPRRTAGQRRALALLGQHPLGELNPAHRLAGAVARPRRVLYGEPAATARAHAAGLLADVGLTPEQAGRRPGACSGGQRQRAALARALAAGPGVLLADEPTSALDAATAGAVLDLIDEHRRRGLAVLLVTHDETVAARADRVLVLRDGVFSARDPLPGAVG
ncbi:ATP-binding cassette domain-containing protein [Streptomyces sp. NPDC049881]|uniref:ABC transporter ATP-binding protein/permease n=1 Tax=Streptomyces sp. NPDC049881 TaxID=3155778 RepID=UPI003418F0AD